MKRLYKILIAEDEALERKVLRHLLEKSGLPVGHLLEAAGGREAVRMALENKPDIIVQDIKMPGMDGLEAARLIREQLPETSIIILTAYDRFQYSQKAIRIGVVDFLLKPVQPEELYRALEAVMKRLESKAARPSLPPADMPVVPAGVRDIADHITAGDRKESFALWESLLDAWLKGFSGNPGSDFLRWFAWEVTVILCQDLMVKSLPVVEINRLKNNQIPRISALADPGDLRRWGLGLIGEIEETERKHINFDQVVIHRVQQYIRENYPREISLNTLANMVHLNQTYLSRLFKQKTGLSFTDFLTRVRLQEAKRLLLKTDRTIDEIAVAIGFKNNSYFTSVFKKREGIKPSEFRSRRAR